MDKYEEIEKDAYWVILLHGTDTETPQYKARQQAARIAEFVRQWDAAEELMNKEEFNLVTVAAFRSPDIPSLEELVKKPENNNEQK